MKLFSQILPLLSLTLFASAAYAQTQSTLTITDEDAPHAAIKRFQDFNASLKPTVFNPPTSNDEVTITGPTYQWSGGTKEVKLVALTGTHNDLKSTYPVAYASPGSQDIIVKCTATFTSTNKKNSQDVKSIPVSGEITVKFFVRIPVKAQQTDTGDEKIYGTDASSSPLVDDATGSIVGFGHSASYNFSVVDNQPTPQPYTDITIHEIIGGYSPNEAYKDDLAYQGAPGTEFTTPPSWDGTFVDDNSWATYNRGGWTVESVDRTSKEGPTDKWYSFSQAFQAKEQKNGAGSYDQPTTLKPLFTVTHRRDSVERK